MYGLTGEEVRKHGTEIHRLPHLALHASAGTEAACFACFDAPEGLVVRWMYGVADPALLGADVPETGATVNTQSFLLYLRAFPARAEAAGAKLFEPLRLAASEPHLRSDPDPAAPLPTPRELHTMTWHFSRTVSTKAERAAWVAAACHLFEKAVSAQLESATLLPALRDIVTEPVLRKVQSSMTKVSELKGTLTKLQALATPSSSFKHRRTHPQH